MTNTTIEPFENLEWVVEMTALLEQINPSKTTWSLRLNVEIQSRLQRYIVYLGQYMREMENRYNAVLYQYRTHSKTKADAEIRAKLTDEYSNWKTAKTYREDLTNLIYAFRAEVKLDINNMPYER